MRRAEQVASQSLSLLLRSSESPTPVPLGSLRLPYLLLLHGRYRMPYVSHATPFHLVAALLGCVHAFVPPMVSARIVCG